jgi:curved DNA-binding protein
VQFKDYYAVLGVTRTSTPEEIKKAYRRLARKYHPDVSKEPDAEAHFKEVQEAYEVLKDPQKRATYDGIGSGNQAGAEFRPPPDWAERFRARGGAPGGDELHAGEFSDFFEQLFGAHGGEAFADIRGGGRPGRGRAVLQLRLEIELEDAYRGATRTLQLAEPDGTRRTVKVRIPAGVSDGELVHAQLEDAGGNAPEVLAEIHLRKHRRFETEGRDVVLVLPVAPWELALGATVRVPTLDGTVEMRIPPGTAAGTRMRLKNRGLPGQPRGSQILVLKVVMPPADTPQAKAIYEQMRRELAFDPRAGL